MKRFSALLILVILVITIQAAAFAIQPVPLKVYYAGNDRLFKEALAAYQGESPSNELDVTVFPSYEEMEARLSVELLSGEGPDVILLDLGSGLDFQKLALNGSLCDLSSYLEQDDTFSSEQYFSSVLDAGKLKDCVYAIPFSFSMPCLITSQEKLDEIGASGMEEMTFDEILSVMKTRAQSLAGEDGALIAMMPRRTDVAYFLYEQSVGSFYGSDGGMVKMDEAAMSKISGFIRAIYDGMPQLQAITRRYRNDFVNAVSRIDFLMEDYQLPVNMRYYDAYYGVGLNQTLKLIPIPGFSTTGGYRVQITEYGIVSANTQQADKAYKLLRYIQDYQTDGVFIRASVQDALEIPVRKDAAMAALDAAIQQTGGYANISGKRTAIPTLKPEFGKQIAAWYEHIYSAYIPNRNIGAIVAEAMDGYYMGTANYDECHDQLTNALWIYMSE